MCLDPSSFVLSCFSLCFIIEILPYCFIYHKQYWVLVRLSNKFVKFLEGVVKQSRITSTVVVIDIKKLSLQYSRLYRFVSERANY